MKQANAEQPAGVGAPSAPEVWWLGLDRKWWVFLTVGIGTFMGALDGSVVNTVLPVIRQSFGADLSTIEWVVLIYLLTLSTLLLTFGRLGDILGHKRIYNLGFVVFTIGSVLCGLSPSESFLIACRALQALGASMLASSSPAILTTTFPPQQRGQVLGMQATMTYLGLVVGPSLGGLLAAQYGWRSIFFINLPIGVLGTLFAFAVIPLSTGAKRREPFDLAGAGVLMLGLGALMFGLSKGQDLGWGSSFILTLLFAAVVLLIAFVWIERRLAHPMLDLSLFSNKLFSAASASAFINYVCVYAVVFLIPFYLVQGRGFSTSRAGLLYTAQPLVMIVVAPLSGFLSDRIGSRILSTSGMVVTAVALFALSRIGPDTSDIGIMAPLALMGLGVGLFVSPNSSSIMGSAPRQRQGVASAVAAMARNTGMVFGVAVAGAIFSTQLAQHSAAGTGVQMSFFGAVDDTFRAIIIIAAIGVITSIVRGSGLATPRGAVASAGSGGPTSASS